MLYMFGSMRNFIGRVRTRTTIDRANTERLSAIQDIAYLLFSFGLRGKKNYEGADIITYLPIDTVGNARKFLRTVRPVMAFFIKYESRIITCISCSIVVNFVYSVSSIFRSRSDL